MNFSNIDIALNESRFCKLIKAEGYEKLLAITISSGLSGTNNMVRLVSEDYEGLDVFVLDTKNIGIGSILKSCPMTNSD